jgi:hypothetical protein
MIGLGLLVHFLIFAIILLVIWYIIRLVAVQLGAPALVIQLAGLVLLLVFILYVLRLLDVPGLR